MCSDKSSFPGVHAAPLLVAVLGLACMIGACSTESEDGTDIGIRDTTTGVPDNAGGDSTQDAGPLAAGRLGGKPFALESAMFYVSDGELNLLLSSEASI